MKFLRKKNWILEWFSYLKYDNINDMRSHDWDYTGNSNGIRSYSCSNCNLDAHLGSVPYNIRDGNEIVFSYRNRIKIEYFIDKDGTILRHCDETNKERTPASH